MRDYEKAEEWQGIKPYKNREKLGFDIFISNLDRQNHGSSSILEYDKIKKKYENEKDGRKKRSLLKLLKQELPAKKRFDELIKEKVFRDGCPRGIGIDPFDWNKVKDLEENHLYDNHGFVTIRGIDVEPEELNRFINDFDDTVTVFKINNPIKNYLLVFGLMGSYWTDGYNQGDGAEIQEKLKEWSAFCKRVENGKSVTRNGYYNQSRQKALENLEKIDDTHSNRYWLLKLIIEHEERYGTQISLIPELIKKRRLIKLLEKWFNHAIIERLHKNLQK
jgi:hypothetical protein